jgi:hypothetical protein
VAGDVVVETVEGCGSAGVGAECEPFRGGGDLAGPGPVLGEAENPASAGGDELGGCGDAWGREVFKDWRLTDERNPEYVKPGSFDTDHAALNTIGIITVAPWPGQAHGTVSGCKSRRR